MDDGPCAFPPPNSIEESFAAPLSVAGFTLIFVSALAQMLFPNLANANRRHGNSYQSSLEVNVDMQPYPQKRMQHVVIIS